MTTDEKRTPVVQTEVDNGVLTITVQGFPTLTIDPRDLPDELVRQAALHGFKQKYVDAAALGATATPAEKHAAITALVNHHRDTGDWNRKAGGDGTAGDGLLVLALAAVTGCTREQARAAVTAMDKKTQAAMRASPELKPTIDRLRDERTMSKPGKGPAPDVGSVLAALRSVGPAPM
jgi:hypothetical protein